MCDEYTATWPKAGIVSNGVAYRGRKWELTIREIGGGLWLTPRAKEPKENPNGFVKRMGDRGSHCRGSLTAQVMWPTPQSRDWKGKSQRANFQENNRDCLPNVAGGQLNPTWVEWLMNFPIGWTDLQPLDMQGFRTWELLNGKATEETIREALRILREVDDPTPLEQWEIRQYLLQEKVLQQSLLRNGERETAANNPYYSSAAPKTNEGDTVQSMRFNAECSEASRQELESNNTMSGMSQERTYETRNVGAWWQEEPPVSRLADGVNDIVKRLKAIGNAQVPLCVATAYALLSKENNR
jgi:hypothetical protein